MKREHIFGVGRTWRARCGHVHLIALALSFPRLRFVVLVDGERVLGGLR